MRRSWAIFGVLVLSATAAHAEDAPRVRLTYRASSNDAGCPSERVFRDLVAARVGRDPFADDAPKSIDASLGKRGAQFHGKVALLDATGKVRGERELDDRSCSDLAESLAIAISILLDPFGRWSKPVVEAPPPPPLQPHPPPSSSPTVPESPPPRSEEPHEVPSRQPLVTVMPSASLTSSLGSAPGLLLGARLGVRFGNARSWSVSGEGAFDSTLGSVDLGRDRVEAERWFAALVPCLQKGALTICVTALLGIFNGSSASVVAPATRRTLFADAGLRAGWSIALGRYVGIEPWVAGTVPLIRTTLRISDETVWRASWVAGTVGVSVLLHGL